MARPHKIEGGGFQHSRWSQLKVEDCSLQFCGLTSGGTGSHTQPVVATHRAPVEDFSP